MTTTDQSYYILHWIGGRGALRDSGPSGCDVDYGPDCWAIELAGSGGSFGEIQLEAIYAVCVCKDCPH